MSSSLDLVVQAESINRTLRSFFIKSEVARVEFDRAPQNLQTEAGRISSPLILIFARALSLPVSSGIAVSTVRPVGDQIFHNGPGVNRNVYKPATAATFSTKRALAAANRSMDDWQFDSERARLQARIPIEAIVTDLHATESTPKPESH